MSEEKRNKLLNEAENHIGEGNTLEALLLLDEAAAVCGWEERFTFLLETAIEEAEELPSLLQQLPEPSAVAAEVKHFQGEVDEAYELLVEYVVDRQCYPLLQWMKNWSSKSDFYDKLTEDKCKILFRKMIGRFGGRGSGTKLAAIFQALYPLVENLVAQKEDDYEMLFYCSSILREGGNNERALEIAEEVFDKNPTWQLAVNLAYARREVGDIDGAKAAFETAARIEPDDDDAQVDLAVMLFDHNRPTEGFEVLNKVLARSPHHFCGFPVYCREVCKRDGDEQKFLELREFASQQRRGTSAFAYAHDCLKTLVSSAPVKRYLPAPEDASIKLLQTVLADTREKITISASCVEAPSVHLALKLATEARGFKLNYKRVESNDWKPNPLAPRRSHKDALWSYKNGEPTLLVEKPDIIVSEMIYSVASGPYHIDEWWDLCNTVARDIGPGAVNDLLGTMVHFDAYMPYPRPSWRWIQAVQVAAAMTLAQLEQHWECPSKETLIDLAQGPVDWVVNGAIVALCQLAKNQEEHRVEVIDVLWQLFEDLEKWHWCTYSTWLRHALLDILKLDSERAQRVRKFFA